VPVFVLLVFGVFQAALIYSANSALIQAAVDGAHTLAAQSSSGPSLPDGSLDPRFPQSYEADGEALLAVQAALITHDLNKVQEIEIFPAVSSSSTPDQATDSYQTRTISVSPDLPSAMLPATMTLVNKYGMQPPSGGPVCQIGTLPFYLLNSASTTGCFLPWDGDSYSYNKNQNGRTDQRCAESLVYMNITYTYKSAFYPVVPALTLSAHSIEPLEPRQYIVDASTQEGIVCSQFPAYSQ
jgi:hypothetical protein